MRHKYSAKASRGRREWWNLSWALERWRRCGTATIPGWGATWPKGPYKCSFVWISYQLVSWSSKTMGIYFLFSFGISLSSGLRPLQFCKSPQCPPFSHTPRLHIFNFPAVSIKALQWGLWFKRIACGRQLDYEESSSEKNNRKGRREHTGGRH